MADVNEVSIPSPSCDWRGVRLCLARGCWKAEYLLSANGGESVELHHQLKMWPSQTAKRPTRSSAALPLSVRMSLMDGVAWGPVGRLQSEALWAFPRSLTNPVAEVVPGSGPCGVGLILCLAFSSHSVSPRFYVSPQTVVKKTDEISAQERP